MNINEVHLNGVECGKIVIALPRKRALYFEFYTSWLLRILLENLGKYGSNTICLKPKHFRFNALGQNMYSIQLNLLIEDFISKLVSLPFM